MPKLVTNLDVWNVVGTWVHQSKQIANGPRRRRVMTAKTPQSRRIRDGNILLQLLHRLYVWYLRNWLRFVFAFQLFVVDWCRSLETNCPELNTERWIANTSKNERNLGWLHVRGTQMSSWKRPSTPSFLTRAHQFATSSNIQLSSLTSSTNFAKNVTMGPRASGRQLSQQKWYVTEPMFLFGHLSLQT